MICPSTRIRKAAAFTGWWQRFINAPVRLGHEYECSGALDRWLTKPDPSTGLHAAQLRK